MINTEVAVRQLGAVVEKLARHIGAGMAVVEKDADGTIEKKVRAIISDVHDLLEKGTVAGDKVKAETAKKVADRAKLTDFEREKSDKAEAEKADKARVAGEKKSEVKRAKEQKASAKK
jgi:hypothetical protein